MEEKNYYNMNKEELLKEFDDINKKSKIASSREFKTLIPMFGSGIAAIILVSASCIYFTKLIIPIIIGIMASYIMVYTGSAINLIKKHNKKVALNNNKIQIQNQLDNIISMNYEKASYALDKELEKEEILTMDKFLDNNNKKIELLKKYKNELSKFEINKNMEKIEHNLHGRIASSEELQKNLIKIKK